MTHRIAEIDLSHPDQRFIRCTCGGMVIDAHRDDYALENAWGTHKNPHRRARKRFTPATPSPLTESRSSRSPDRSLEAKVAAAHNAHPTWSNAKIQVLVGCGIRSVKKYRPA